ncbi:MAG: glycosyltransferase family 2 protein [Deltaproteobacteria bacterium]|nr:MAG: glycosyltransferase family 2 protein [Deltaproteobacteria bacterium]
MRLSVAIPFYNEEAGVRELLERLRRVLDRLPGGPHEIVLVDDGSSDATFELLATAARDDPRIVAISLSRNFGHQAALAAALDHVSGDLVVVMDGDLQDPPEVIPSLIEQQAKGFDVVYVRRVARKERWPLRVCYFLFYRLISLLSDVRLPLDAGDFALLSRRVVDLLRQLPEHHRYLRGLRSWTGFCQVGIAIERPERFAGRSKYNALTLLGLAFDALFAFSMVPLRVAALIGLLTAGGSVLFALYSLYVRVFLGPRPQGFTALIVAITFLSGVQLLFLGLIGEYVGRVYEETKARPHYVVAEIVRGARQSS